MQQVQERELSGLHAAAPVVEGMYLTNARIAILSLSCMQGIVDSHTHFIPGGHCCL